MSEYVRVVKPLLKWMNAHKGCKAINIHGSKYSENGTPDIFAVWKGTPLVIECKVNSGTTTPIQKHRLKEWSETGTLAFVFNDFQTAKEVLTTTFL